jgi:outer membrane biosynthesis protein TonB
MSFVIQPTTVSDDSLKNSLIASGIAHFVFLLLVIFGLPHLMPPLPEEHHPPVPFEIVQIADLTNTRLEQPEEPKQLPAPPPKPETKPEQVQVQPAPKPPEPKVESLTPTPLPKPKPPEVVKPQSDQFAKLLKTLDVKKPAPPKTEDAKTDSKAEPQPQSQAPALSNRLTISQEDALRRQISQCWNIPIGAKDAQNLIVQVSIDVNPDRTVQHAEIVDKMRMATDSYFRAAAEAALRALYSPQCTPLELPADKYQEWKHIDFTFDPRDML